MNEDNKPLYDIPGLWETSLWIPNGVQIDHHKEYDDLKRYIDFKQQRVMFSDDNRVTPELILDINKGTKIPDDRKKLLSELGLKLINLLKPIEMPYKPEQIKVYVEDLGPFVGFLYFMERSDSEDKDLVPIKKYFEVVNDPVVHIREVPFEEYQKFKEENINVDKA